MPDSEDTRLTEAREQAIRAELSGLLESPAFRTSKRCRDFLGYVVEHTLRGPGESLKERSLGVDLFQLPPDFDASQHTIVRVTANEVRKKLAQHYLTGNGATHEVRIELPPGSYRAEFKWAPAAAPETMVPAAAPETTVPAAAPGRRWWPIAAGAAALVLIGGSLALWKSQEAAPSPPAEVPRTPSGAVVAPPADGDGVRLIVGATRPYLDRSGRSWGIDQYFSGGMVMFRASERILRTLDPDVYRHSRIGEFRYDIPLKKGTYELRLHFAETGLSDFVSAESSGEGQRVFRILANGKTLLNAFDVVADAAGPNIADERVFRDITPAEDGFLHLSFVTLRGSPMVSAIELLPTQAGQVRPVRIRSGWTTSWQDGSGRAWQSDSYFLGGNALVRSTNPARESSTVAQDAALCASERWGHFSYAIPVAEGRYRVTLKFCEGHYGRRNAGGGGIGSRLFDVYGNGVALLRNFDILKEAGEEGRLLERTFSGMRPTAQGKIVLNFVPVEGMACVNGIEVVEESR